MYINLRPSKYQRDGSLTWLGHHGCWQRRANVWTSVLPCFSSSLISFALGKTYLAYGTSDGGVGLIVVTQSLRSIPTNSGFGENYNVDVLHELHSHQPSDSDGRGISALSWIEMPTKNVHCFLYSSFFSSFSRFYSSFSSIANQEPFICGPRSHLQLNCLLLGRALAQCFCRPKEFPSDLLRCIQYLG